MKIVSLPRFVYPNWGPGLAWCNVDVYRKDEVALVVLRDQDDHDGTSVTNTLEEVARRVREEVLRPHGLEGLEAYWIHWSRTDKIASTVHFRDPRRLEGPQWQYLSPAEFQKILAAFEAPDQLEVWIREGAVDLKGCEESKEEQCSRDN